MLSDAFGKKLKLAFANPNETARLLMAAALFAIAATPIAAIALVGYALHKLPSH